METSDTAEVVQRDPQLQREADSAIVEIQRSVEDPVVKMANDTGSASVVSLLKDVASAYTPYWKKQLEIATRDAQIIEMIVLAYLPLYKKFFDKKRGEALEHIASSVSGQGTRKGAPVLEKVFGRAVEERYQAARLEGANMMTALGLGLFGGTADDAIADALSAAADKLKVGKLAKIGSISVGRWLAKKITGPNLYPDVPKALKNFTSVTFYFFPDTWLAVPLWQLFVNRMRSLTELKQSFGAIKPIVGSYLKQRIGSLQATESAQAARMFLPEASPAGAKPSV